MTNFRHYYNNTSGATIERFAVIAAFIALGSITGTKVLDQITHSADRQAIETAAKTLPSPRDQLAGMGSLDGPPAPTAPIFNNVDTSATASISTTNGRPIVLDPCTGKSK